jgi:hypothetical protein
MSKFTPILVPSDADADLRDGKRRHVLMRATVIGIDGPQSAHVRDLTSTGARVRCDPPLREGEDVMLKRGDLFVPARVAWTTKDEAGLQFYRELSSES